MNKFNLRFLLLFIMLVFFAVLFVLSVVMIMQDTTIAYGAEPSPTLPVLMRPTPTINEYPIPQSTENVGYPIPMPYPTENIGYPVPVPSDPPVPTPDYEGEGQLGSPPPILKTKDILNMSIIFENLIETVEYHGLPIFEMR